LAYILSALAGFEKSGSGNYLESIDGKEAQPYIGFTESRTDLWEFFGEVSHRRWIERMGRTASCCGDGTMAGIT
jgi:hypothetical protein